MDLMGFRGYSQEFPRYPSLFFEIRDST